jgi:hypothetical protein
MAQVAEVVMARAAGKGAEIIWLRGRNFSGDSRSSVKQDPAAQLSFILTQKKVARKAVALDRFSRATILQTDYIYPLQEPSLSRSWLRVRF